MLTLPNAQNFRPPPFIYSLITFRPLPFFWRLRRSAFLPCPHIFRHANTNIDRDRHVADVSQIPILDTSVSRTLKATSLLMLPEPLFFQFPRNVIRSPYICLLILPFRVLQILFLLWAYPLVLPCARQVVFLFHTRLFFALAHLCHTKLKSAPFLNAAVTQGLGFIYFAFPFFDRLHRKSLRLIDDLSVISTLQSLTHHRAADSLFAFYRYYSFVLRNFCQQLLFR